MFWKIYPVQLDVTKASGRAAVAKQIAENIDHLDILINNAALGAPEGTLITQLTSATPEKD